LLEIAPEGAIMPPLGLITVAALCPEHWQIRLVDRAFEELEAGDLEWANLVMVSAMHAQREDAFRTLELARALGRRTIVGGPYASSQPEVLAPLADHVVAGEPDDTFGQIARELELGTAKAVYRIADKPDLRNTPPPRFDLLNLSRYTSMPVQFSRGCPFQCEFCDIITIYGRRPRTKSPGQLIAELDLLREAGWNKQVFIVDDNFIGNHRKALELAEALASWQERHHHPFIFHTEASIDLAQRPGLIDAMVRANFLYVFIGVETPSVQSLQETKKFQNLRCDQLESIRYIQLRGLWVTAGFIVGFDSDGADIFDRQIEFIERAAIPWAMVGVLQAPPTTALFDRLLREGRLILESTATSNFSPPDFRTVMPLADLLGGMRRLLLEIYPPERFYERAWRSLAGWRPRKAQHAPPVGILYQIQVVLRSLWIQGVRAPYRAVYWRFLARLLARWSGDRRKLWLGFVVLMSGHHFISYAAETAAELSSAIPDSPAEVGRAPENAGIVDFHRLSSTGEQK
jgi:radical SAM superfamily enzyme YgiQ (UPF0313 family)